MIELQHSEDIHEHSDAGGSKPRCTAVTMASASSHMFRETMMHIGI